MTLREILDAIHALPRPDRLRLLEQLNDDAMDARLSGVELQPPPGSMLDLVDGFYVYTGPLSDPDLDHRESAAPRAGYVLDNKGLDGEVEVFLRPVGVTPRAPDVLDVIAALPAGTRSKDDIERRLAEDRAGWNGRG